MELLITWSRSADKIEKKLPKKSANCEMTGTDQKVYDCIIIGAGVSGLCAAKYLKEAKFTNILVLEADSRVGGRTYTARNANVSYVDLGGTYVGPNQSNILRIAGELKVKTSKVFADGKLVVIFDGKRSVYNANGITYNAEDTDSSDLNKFMEKLDEIGKEIPAEDPWNAPNAKQLDKMTWKQFVESNCSEKSRLAALSIANDVFGAAPHELSSLFVLWYIKMGQGTVSLFSDAGGAQDSKFEGGAMQISERISEILGPKKVLTNKVVYCIDQAGNTIRLKTLDECEYETKTVIIAIPPCVQSKIHYNPPLPPIRNQMLQRFPMGTVMKSVVYYKNAFWREKGLCGAASLYGDQGYVTTVYDNTQSDGTKPSLSCMLFAEKCREIWELSLTKRISLVCDDLSELFDSKDALSPIHYEEYNWSSSQYCGGGYTGICPPGFLTQFGPVMRKPVNKLFFAGTETATVFSGYMDGAVQAGERAAKEVIQELSSRCGDKKSKLKLLK